jgi:transposase InsO family protein
LVQLDTLHIAPLPGVRRWHFTARDVISRWDVVEVHSRGTSQAAEAFLGTLRERFPFRVKALQIDGGSEFKAFFEQACQRLRIPLYLLPPRSPKLNAHVERANGTHRQEFYETTADCPWSVTELNQRLRKWEYVYNHIRPHQSLGYLTPAEYLKKHHPRGFPSHM